MSYAQILGNWMVAVLSYGTESQFLEKDTTTTTKIFARRILVLSLQPVLLFDVSLCVCMLVCSFLASLLECELHEAWVSVILSMVPSSLTARIPAHSRHSINLGWVNAERSISCQEKMTWEFL